MIPFHLRSRYPKGYTLMKLGVGKPTGFSEWRRAIWGTDIFINRVPLIKTEIAIFVLGEVLRWR